MSDAAAGGAACDATREHLPAAALDALSDAEMREVMAHVGRCEPCHAELVSLRRMASQLTYATPLEPVERARIDIVRARLHERALKDGLRTRSPGAGEGRGLRGATDHQESKQRTRAWLIGAALVMSMGALVTLVRDVLRAGRTRR